MSMFKKLFSKEEVAVQVVEPQAPQVFTAQVKEGPRTGMWVMTHEGVGVLTADNEVTLVNDDGSNKLVVEGDKAVPHKVTVDTLTQAFIEDIPVTRRADIGLVYTLGYKHKEQA